MHRTMHACEINSAVRNGNNIWFWLLAKGQTLSSSCQLDELNLISGGYETKCDMNRYVYMVLTHAWLSARTHTHTYIQIYTAMFYLSIRLFTEFSQVTDTKLMNDSKLSGDITRWCSCITGSICHTLKNVSLTYSFARYESTSSDFPAQTL